MIWNSSLRRFVLALITSVGMLVVGVGFLGATLDRYAIARAAYDAANAERQKVTTRLESAQRDEPAMRRALERFTALQHDGLVGQEHRLDWGERVKRIKAARRIPLVEFELAPQRVFGQPYPDLTLRASRMTLRVRLAHEGDLVRLLADLDNPGTALILPRQCSLQRDTDQLGANPTAIIGSCELDWITLNLTPPTRP